MSEIEAFVEREKKALSWYEGHLKIWTTKEFVNPSLNTKLPAETVIKRTSSFSYLLFYLGFIFICYLKAPSNKTSLYGMMAIHLIIYLLYLVISWINPSEDEDDVASITLNKDGIRLNKMQINWCDIQETYIMNKRTYLGKGRGIISNLIIHKMDNTIGKIDTNTFVASDIKLATLIEHYKNSPK